MRARVLAVAAIADGVKSACCGTPRSATSATECWIAECQGVRICFHGDRTIETAEPVFQFQRGVDCGVRMAAGCPRLEAYFFDPPVIGQFKRVRGSGGRSMKPLWSFEDKGRPACASKDRPGRMQSGRNCMADVPLFCIALFMAHLP
jgi:hypothetical protein